MNTSWRHPDISPYWLLTAASLLWAGNIIAGRALRLDISPVALSVMRWSVAAVLLLPLAGREAWRHRQLFMAQWPLMVVLAVLGVALYNVISYTAVSMAPAANIAVVGAVMPVWIVLVAVLLRVERLRGIQCLGIVISLTGALLVAAQGDPARLLALHLGRGELWSLFGGALWGVYSVLYGRVPREPSAPAVLLVLVLLGLLALLPLWWWEGRTGAAVPWAWSWHLAVGVAYVGIGAATLAFLAWNAGVAAVGPNRASVFLHLVPLVAVGLAVLLLGESLRWFHLTALPLVLGGIWLTSRPGRVSP